MRSFSALAHTEGGGKRDNYGHCEHTRQSFVILQRWNRSNRETEDGPQATARSQEKPFEFPRVQNQKKNIEL